MSFKEKDIIVLLLSSLFFILFSITSNASEDLFINDEAEILSDDGIEGFKEYRKVFKNELEGDLYLLTVPSLENIEPLEYAKREFKNKDGILLLIAPNEGTGTIYLSQDYIRDFDRNDLLEVKNIKIEENLKLGQFDQSVIESLEKVFEVLNESRNLNMEVDFKLKNKTNKDNSVFWIVALLLILLLIIDIVFLKSYFINTISRALIGFKGEYRGNISPYRTSERYRGAGTGPRDDWPSDLDKKNKYGNW